MLQLMEKLVLCFPYDDKYKLNRQADYKFEIWISAIKKDGMLNWSELVL